MKKIFKNLIIVGVVIILIAIVVLFYFLFGKNTPLTLTSIEAKNGDIVEKINLTGQVKASQGVDMAFVVPGKIVANYVKAGDKIYTGQTLAVLDQSSAEATLISAQGSLAQAQANYEKLTAGSTQQASLNSVYADALNSLNDAYLKSYNALVAVTNLQNTYFVGFDGDARQGKAQIVDAVASLKSSLDKAKDSKLQADVDEAIYTSTHSLNIISDALRIIRETCDSTFYYSRIPDSEKTALDNQRTYIITALTAITKTQEALFQNGPNMDLAQAQILSAQGQVNSARAVLNNTVLSAPFGGQVDKNNVVVGAIASPNVPVITISNNNFEVDTNVSEIDMGNVKLGDVCNVTLDAFGQNVIFPATIISIDSAPTIVNGVSVYQARLKFTNADDRIKTGMTANIIVTSEKHSNVLIIPRSAIIQQNGKYFVIVDNENSKKESREVSIGFRDDKNIEIISGLKAGEKVLAY